MQIRILNRVFLMIGLPLLFTAVILFTMSHKATAVGNTVTGADPVVSLVDAFPNLTFSGPVDIANAGDGRLFIVEQAGRIRVTPLDPDSTQALIFLNITDRVGSGGERGLLGLAFHPNYTDNGYFYVNYTNLSGNTRVSRFQVTTDPNAANPNSELILMEFSQPFSNHNGGDVAFGPDGYLYIATGDGGSGGDPNNNGQTTSTLLGNILRIDVDGGGLSPDCDADGNYTIPPDNPLLTAPAACDEIWAYGLRNPWRISFDRATGDLFIADVGQNAWEEIDLQPAASAGGENYGWRCYEGNHPYNLTGCGDISLYTFPVYEYSHGGSPFRCSITGGFIYRGLQYPNLQGTYLYGDYCSGQIWGLTNSGTGWTNTQLYAGSGMTTFGEDACGGIYVPQGSKIYHVQDTSTPAAPNLCLTKSGPTIADVQTPITYTIQVNNTGAVTATNLTITDTLPDGASYVSGGTFAGSVVSWQVANLAAKSSLTLQFVVTATQTITNASYQLTADGGYVTSGSHAVTTVIRPAALSISKTGPDEAFAGDPITYTLTVMNGGPGAASGLLITDTLPVGASYVSGGALNGDVVSWQVPSLPAQGSVAVQFVVTATATIVNETYGVWAAGGFAAQGSEVVTTTVITPAPLLRIDKTGPLTVSAGDPITYTLTIRNDGILTATNLVITDVLPANTVYVSGGVLADGVVSWMVEALGPDTAVAVQFTVTAADTARNEQYGVLADGGYGAVGDHPVVTFIDGVIIYVPFARVP
ncbi:MAG: PQQ-dependent sugar dehydrogenase [Anaerolinea sp.]|nr:PQQ-dependent sugar dehydrogenase [Anaerolinea sp.]